VPDPDTSDSTAVRVAELGLAGVVGPALIGALATVLSSSAGDADDGDASPAPPSVAAVSVSSPVGSFTVRCPMTFTFTGSIDVASGEGIVVYRWLRTDGFGGSTLAGDRQTARAAGPGTITVVDEWTPSVPSGQVSRTATLQVLEPRNLRSAPGASP